MFAAVFSITRYKVSVLPFECLCSRLFPFPSSLAFCSMKFVRETLCKFLHIYAK